MVTRIRQLLEQKQLTPTQFADAIGVGRPVMSHILSERNKPSLEVVQRIIEAFPDVSMPWLLKGVGEMLESDVKFRAPESAPSSPVKPEAPAPAADTPAEPVALPAELAAPVLPQPVATPAVAMAPAASEPATVAKNQEKETEMPPVTPPVVPARPVAFASAVLSAHPEPTAAPSAPAPKPFAAARFIRSSTSAPAIAPPPVVTPALVATLAPVAPAPFTPATSPAPVAPAVATVPATSATPAASAVPASASAEAAFLPFLNDSGKAIRRIVIFYRDGSFADYQPEQ